MKKNKFLAIVASATLLMACGTYGALDLSRVDLGMSKDEVVDMFGPYDKVLSATKNDKGYEEVVEYTTNKDEIYALEFLNGFLTRYEFLYTDDAPKTTYVYPPYPSYCDYWRPPILVIPNNPKQPKPQNQHGNGVGQTLPTVPQKGNGR